MNRTNFEHGIISAIATVVLFFLLGNLLVAFIAPVSFFLGREHAQREYKIGDPSKLYGYEAFDFWRWSLDAKLDLVFPVVFSGLLTVLIWKIKWIWL